MAEKYLIPKKWPCIKIKVLIYSIFMNLYKNMKNILEYSEIVVTDGNSRIINIEGHSSRLPSIREMGVFVTGTDSPVNIASFTITLPKISTASQDISNLPLGSTMTSPGTKSLEEIVSILSPCLLTTALLEQRMVERRFSSFFLV